MMREGLKSRLDLFADNTLRINKDFTWQNVLVKRLAALLYTAEDKPVDCIAIRDCHELIKKMTGIFSTFRGNTAISIATMLSLCDDRERQISNTLTVYDIMKDVKFRASDYLVLAAYQIAANEDPMKYRQTVVRAKDFYEGMKDRHWFYTGQDDYIFSAMFAMTDIDISVCVEQIEQLYGALKTSFFSGNSVQALAQTLVLGGKRVDIIPRVLELREALHIRKLRLDKEYTLSSLGVLALLPDDADSIADDISETYDFLRTQKGFGSWSVTKQELLLLSAALLALLCADESQNSVLTTALSTSITSIIIAQQAAAATTSATAATTAR